VHNSLPSALRRLGRTAGLGLLTSGLVFASATAAAAYEPGVDTSHYQHGTSLNWAKVKADGVEFAFLKATESTTYTDPYFASDWAATRSVGIYHGAYHFAQPGKSTADAQARYFVKVAGLANQPGDLPPVLDLETTGGLGVSALRTWTSNWLKTVKSLTGRTPIIYVSPSFWETNLGNSTAFTGYPLWIANYGVSKPRVPGGWSTWTFWQTSSSGRVNGISGNVDTDLFNGTRAQLATLAQMVTTPPPTTTKLTLKTSAPGAYAGQSVTLSGALTDAAGKPVTAKTVSLYRLPSGSTTWAQVGSVPTDATGAYSLPVSITGSASYQARFAAGSGYAADNSPRVAVALVPPADTTLSAQPSATQVYDGESVSFVGALTDASGQPAPSRSVVLYRAVEGATGWSKVGTATTGATGAYSVGAPVKQTASYRVRFLGDTQYVKAASPTVPVNLLAPEVTSLTLTAGAPGAYAGQTMRLTGTLLDSSSLGVRRRVLLERRADGATPWTRLAMVWTGSDGAVSIPVQVDSTADYRLRFPGGTRYAAATSTTLPVQLLPPNVTRLTLNASRHHVARGERATLSGRLTLDTGAGLGTRRVRIYRHLVGVPGWRPVTTLRTAPGGRYRLSIAPRRANYFKAVFGGGVANLRSASPRTEVSVR
jgi:GH25 family lysozyme M1 (1,4-beta-N-acetylmuramidase)/5-hydroxyisourate hydrolase-like protein (transthyretin family)